MPKKTSNKTKPRLNVSKAEQWVNCPGSLSLEKNSFPLESAEQAIKGTLIHRIAQNRLEGDKILDGFFSISEILILEKNREEINLWVDFYYSKILLDIEALKEEYEKQPELLIEYKIEHETSHFSAVCIIDAALIVKTKEKTIIKVYDLKTGFVEVSAQDNLQLFISALMLSKKYKAKSFELSGCIVQPSLNLISTESFPYIPEILDSLFTPSDKSKFVVGPHCRYCDYKDVCGVFQKRVKEYLNPRWHDTSFDRREKWAELLDIAGPIIKMFEQIKSNAYQASQLGVTIPKYTFADKAGRCTWISDMRPETIEKKLKLKKGQAQETKLISPKTAEDFIKGDNKKKEIFEKLVYTPTIRYLKRDNEGFGKLQKRGKKDGNKNKSKS